VLLRNVTNPSYDSIPELQTFLQNYIKQGYKNNAPTDLVACVIAFQKEKKTFLEFVELFSEHSHSFTFSNLLGNYVKLLTEIRSLEVYVQLPAEIQQKINILLGNEKEKFSFFSTIIKDLKKEISTYLNSFKHN